jgi:hypothetical protein|tara:strand:- start:1049 stop:1429 length:381 start_codon:yes stop_codon:yes gene_type:complete
MKYKLSFIAVLLLIIGFSFNASAEHHAEKKRVFTEDEFISLFSGKPKSRVLKYLGKPDSTDIAIKPKGASSVLGRPTIDKKNKNKKSKIEMWYYNNVVEYSPKKTYLKVELTLINDRIVNIGFFNQ